MNKFICHNDELYEVRPDMSSRSMLSYRDGIRYFNNTDWIRNTDWTDGHIWEYLIERGEAKFVELEEFIEENFEKLL
jgi:hypothetical protein